MRTYPSHFGFLLGKSKKTRPPVGKSVKPRGKVSGTPPVVPFTAQVSSFPPRAGEADAAPGVGHGVGEDVVQELRRVSRFASGNRGTWLATPFQLMATAHHETSMKSTWKLKVGSWESQDTRESTWNLGVFGNQDFGSSCRTNSVFGNQKFYDAQSGVLGFYPAQIRLQRAKRAEAGQTIPGNCGTSSRGWQRLPASKIKHLKHRSSVLRPRILGPNDGVV